MTGPTAGPTTWLDYPLRQDTLTHEPRCLTPSCIPGCTLQVRAHSLAIATAESRLHRPVRAALVRACHVLPNFAPNSGTTLQLRHFRKGVSSTHSPALRSQISSLFETLPHPPCVSPFHPPGLLLGTLSFSSPSPRLGPGTIPALHASSALRGRSIRSRP